MKKLKLDELGRLTVEAYRNVEKIPVVILLDNIRSLHNVGSVFRTADAFRIQKIFLTGITGTPPHREIHKTALGATESVPWQYEENGEELTRQLKEDGYKIIIVEQTSESVSLHQFEPSPTEKYCLVFGNEVNGVKEEILGQGDAAIEIPQFGTKHSINISVCVGIVVWEIVRKIKLNQP